VSIHSVAASADGGATVSYRVRNSGAVAANQTCVRVETATVSLQDDGSPSWQLSSPLGAEEAHPPIPLEAGQELHRTTEVERVVGDSAARVVVVSASEATRDPLGPTRRRELLATAMSSGNLLGGVDPPPITDPGRHRVGAWSTPLWRAAERVDERTFPWRHPLDPAVGRAGGRGIRGDSDAPGFLQLLTPRRPLRHGPDTVAELEYLVREPESGVQPFSVFLASHPTAESPDPVSGPMVHEVHEVVEVLAPVTGSPTWRQRRLELPVPQAGLFIGASFFFDDDRGDYLLDGLSLSQRHRQMAIAWLPGPAEL